MCPGSPGRISLALRLSRSPPQITCHFLAGRRSDGAQILIRESRQDPAGGGAKVSVFESFKWKSASARSNLIGRLPLEMEVSAKTKDHQSDRSGSC